MKRNFKSVIFCFAFVLVTYSEAFCADSGSCGENCRYNYDPLTQTLTYTGTGPNGSGIISKTSVSYGLSGTVKNAIISEGITDVIFESAEHHNILRDMGTSDGKLIIPSTMKSFSNDAAANLGFGVVEINSKNINFGSESLGVGRGASNAQIIISADANISFNDGTFYWNWGGVLSLPTNLHIACKGNPDACLAKFGHSLDRMNSDNITADYYEERDENGNLTLKYDDSGYNKYDGEGNVIERWNLNNTEQYDRKGHVIATYDGKGNLLQSFVYGADNSVSIYDKSGKLIGLQGKRILSVDEATALVKDNKNTFKLRYR